MKKHWLPSGVSTTRPIPASAGIGLRAEHYHDVLRERPPVGWLEVHSENYFGEGGKPLAYLEQIRGHYPLSLHGVGLSLGSTDPLNQAHLSQLKRLINRLEPGLVSEHVSWCSIGGRYLHDLIPLPYTEENLRHLVSRVQQAQELLDRQLLMENLSSYVQYNHSSMPEWEFLAELARRSGCGLLLDVNNVYVSSVNHGLDAKEFITSLPVGAVREIHLAGHTRKSIDEISFVIDTHDRPVAGEVWDLYRLAVGRYREVPVLIEWDADLPELEVLLAEAQRAQAIMDQHYALIA